MTPEEVREIVRSEVLSLAAKIEPREKKGFWYFLNSSLGIWVLSSLVLGGITYLYSSISASQAADIARQERMERLDSELELRFDPVVKRINKIRDLRQREKGQPPAASTLAKSSVSPDAKTIWAPGSLKAELAPEETRILFNRPVEPEQYQKEFSKHTVKSLFAEAYFLSRDTKEKAAIQAALAQIESARIYDRAITMLKEGKFPPDSGASFQADAGEMPIEAYNALKKRSEETAISDAQRLLPALQAKFEGMILDAWNFWHRRNTSNRFEPPSPTESKGSPLPTSSVPKSKTTKPPSSSSPP